MTEKEMDVKLTPVERILLLNQLRILEKLYPNEGYDRWREAVEGGYTLHYDHGAPWLGSEMDEAQCREVLDILDMYRSLSWSYDQLDDTSGIDERDVRFAGFDGNNESDYLGYADYQMHVLGHYEESAVDGHAVNSHGQMLEMYRRLLPVWEALRYSNATGAPLTAEQIKRVVAERIHPDNRKKEAAASR
jgi:uncharacterized protein